MGPSSQEQFEKSIELVQARIRNDDFSLTVAVSDFYFGPELFSEAALQISNGRGFGPAARSSTASAAALLRAAHEGFRFANG
jgi:hypothetical protein